MDTPRKKDTPEALARQFITLDAPTGPTSNVNPHKCVCFGGFCLRQFCHQKTYKGRDVAEDRRFVAGSTDKVQRVRILPTPKGQLSTWRADGSHTEGRVPEGRIPEHVRFDAKGHPVLK